MTPAQLSYLENQEIGLPGQLSDSGPNDIISRLAEVQIPFGRIVVLGTEPDKQARLPDQAIDISNDKKVLGASLHSHARESRKNDIATTYSQGESVSILKDGRILMEAEQIMVPENSVFVRFAGKKQVQTIAWDANFVTGNIIDGKINGTAITSIPFNTDQTTTISDIANALKNSSNDIESASVTGTQEITITSIIDKNVVFSEFTVTGGASQASETISETVSSIPTSDRGKIRSDNDSNTAEELAGAKIRKSASGTNNIVVLELDL